MSKVPQYKKMNWVLYIEQCSQKKKTEYDALLDKVLELAKPLGQLYGIDSLSVYCSPQNVHVEFIVDKRHLFVNMIPIQDIKQLTNKQCELILNRLIQGLNTAKRQLSLNQF